MRHFKILKPVILVLCGSSGSGKSTLEQNLIKDHPNLFYKLQQFSTRAMRPGETFGNPYSFIQRETFSMFRDRLIGVIGCAPDSHFKDMYGSLPDFLPGKIPTIILADEGLVDLKEKIEDINSQFNEYDVFVIGLDVKYEDLSEDDRASRANRNPDFVAKERNVLRHADATYTNCNGKYVNPREVIERFLSCGYIEELDTKGHVTSYAEVLKANKEGMIVAS